MGWDEGKRKGAGVGLKEGGRGEERKEDRYVMARQG